MHSSKELIYEYIQIRTGEKDVFSNKYFGRISKELKERNTINFYKDVFEIFLKWTPGQIKTFLTSEVLKAMKIDMLFNYLPLPPEMTDSYNRRWLDYSYVAHILYPNEIRYDKEALTIRVYKDILSDSLYSFPKRYFDGYDGGERALTCFRYMVNNYETFRNAEEYYAYFSSTQGRRDIDKYKLTTVMHDIYGSPINFAHEAAPDEIKDEALFHYYKFLYHYKKEEQAYLQNIRKAEKARKNNA